MKHISLQLSNKSDQFDVYCDGQYIGNIRRYRPMCGQNNDWTCYPELRTEILDDSVVAEIHKIVILLNGQ